MDDRAATKLSLSDRFSRAAQWTSQQCGRAYTFIAAILIILVWAISGPAFHYSDTWQLIINTGTTIVTFLMVFLIQNTQNRDTTAVQLKLDELIRANENAHNRMMRLEDLTENQIKHLKENLPVEAIRKPLEAAQQGLAKVSGGIEEAKSPLPGEQIEPDRGIGEPQSDRASERFSRG
jgi:low affinity Fe/Cu permease